ncbi:MAG: DUF192 domain-containing protein [Rhizobiales bacterium]|nr:DUF192 domain-containing protein [Hyphomicrobiales bacterium]
MLETKHAAPPQAGGFAILFLALIAFGQPAVSKASDMPRGTVTIETSSGQHKFTVERAETQEHQSRGLMHRRHMKADHGMLFTWPNERNVSMWMANTILPLDMVFIKKNGKVHRVHKNTIPFSQTIIEAGAPVLRVLELNAGTADKIGLKPGDTVQLN